MAPDSAAGARMTVNEICQKGLLQSGGLFEMMGRGQ